VNEFEIYLLCTISYEEKVSFPETFNDWNDSAELVDFGIRKHVLDLIDIFHPKLILKRVDRIEA
jgi:hypothetical protein